MLTYVYDGSLEGLFTALYEGLFAGEEVVEITDKRRYQPSLFATAKIITTDPEKARKLRRFLRERLSRQAFQNLVYCYLSEAGMERTILSYIKLLLPGGRKAAGDPQARTREMMAIIDAITETAQKVAFEVHRFHGFLRFRQVYDDLYYAPIEPDHNILALLVPHFTARFANQKWFIHDRRRNLGAYYDGRECRLVNDVAINDQLTAALEGKRTGIEGEEEMRCRELWQEYFTTIALEERRNEKLQRQHMPVRYWKYLTEFEPVNR
jgi:probable DNA metabolism protein